MRRFDFLVPAATVTAMLLCAAGGLEAQSRNGSDDAREVRAVVDRLFDAMRAGDSAALRDAFHPAARLVSIATRDGQSSLREESIEQFVRAVGTPRPEVLDERIDNVEIRVDGALATAWMQYTFFVGERFSHCGVNAFQLFRDADGWLVIQIADTRRREGCPTPGA